jgi:hypothetical protein
LYEILTREDCKPGDLDDRRAEGGELPEQEGDTQLLQEVLVVLPGGHYVPTCGFNTAIYMYYAALKL